MNEIQYSKIEDVLAEDGMIVVSTAGFSMWPMLRERRDLSVIETIRNPLAKNDVVLYKRKNGQYVLHRIIRVHNDIYTMRGDNCTKNEDGIKSEDIIGILKGFYKKDKYIDCKKNLGYKIYVLLCRFTYGIRIPFEKLYRLIKCSFSIDFGRYLK